MSPDLERKIVVRWPDWFDIHGDPRTTAMPRGFEHGDGWFWIVYRLCEHLDPLVRDFPKDAHFEVLQVKQKFGGLRFYVSHHTAAIDGEVDVAGQESLRTCEQCGRPGTLRNIEGWLVTRCDECLHAGEDDE